MEIFLEKRAIKQIRNSAGEAIEEGDSDSLRDDIVAAFSEEQIEEIERRVDAVDFYDFVSEILDEWSGDETDELFELLEGHLADVGIEVKYTATDVDGDDDDEVDDDDDDDADEDLEEFGEADTEEEL